MAWLIDPSVSQLNHWLYSHHLIADHPMIAAFFPLTTEHLAQQFLDFQVFFILAQTSVCNGRLVFQMTLGSRLTAAEWTLACRPLDSNSALISSVSGDAGCSEESACGDRCRITINPARRSD